MIALCSISILQTASYTAARSTPIKTASDTLQYPSDGIVFPTSPLSFPTESLSFPTTLDRLETPTTIEVVLPADVLFDFDKADIRPIADGTLHELAQIIRDRSRGAVVIQGYTDSLGGDVYNQRLSERRAAAVKSWLVAHERLPTAMLAAAGFGARNPVAPNRRPDGSDDPEGRQRNRRVTILVHK
jgi:outer membrane protein OmpA-like peptidoglycan-associated protein